MNFSVSSNYQFPTIGFINALSMQNGKQENIEVYFSASLPSTIIDRIVGVNGTSIYETLNGNLYSDNLLTTVIGRIAISQTIFDILDSNMSGVFETTGQTTLFLPTGNITYVFSGQTIRTPDGRYVFPTVTYTFKTTSGTGYYQSSYGDVKITSLDSIDDSVLLRKFNIDLTFMNY
uniref:Uncharacterized protein n=1 Tax=viral metagenome TaxID=1070528 RepID=A0A6C0KID4_9ZZZZ